MKNTKNKTMNKKHEKKITIKKNKKLNNKED